MSAHERLATAVALMHQQHCHVYQVEVRREAHAVCRAAGAGAQRPPACTVRTGLPGARFLCQPRVCVVRAHRVGAARGALPCTPRTVLDISWSHRTVCDAVAASRSRMPFVWSRRCVTVPHRLQAVGVDPAVGSSVELVCAWGLLKLADLFRETAGQVWVYPTGSVACVCVCL